MAFSTVEEAYSGLASYLIAFIGGRSWDMASANFRVFSTMANCSQWLEHLGSKDESGGFETSSDAIWTGLDAALFLRDDLLKTTGQRIWGLTFTLYPDGKFNIEYDYNKPEGYEETDDAISGDEINSSLGKLGNKGPQ